MIVYCVIIPLPSSNSGGAHENSTAYGPVAWALKFNGGLGTAMQRKQ